MNLHFYYKIFLYLRIPFEFVVIVRKQIEVCLFFDCKNKGNKEAQCASLCLPLLPFLCLLTLQVAAIHVKEVSAFVCFSK